jgi:Flp pilus assembly protein TadD
VGEDERFLSEPTFRETETGMGTMALSASWEERFQRGVAMKVDGRYEEATAELLAVLEERPDYAPAHHELGLVYGFTGMFDESIEELKRAVELEPSDLKGRNDLALTYAMLGMNEEARAGFETVLEMDPTNATALRNIVYFR